MFTPRCLGAVGTLAACALVGAPAHGALLFSGVSGTREAEVTVEVNDDELVITLANTSGFDVERPSDLLTAMFFNITVGEDEDPVSLVPTSAVLGDSSVVLFGSPGPDGNVGGEWAYAQGLNERGPGGTSYGISSAGLNFFGPKNRFPGENLDGPNSPNGMGFALASIGDDPTRGNRPVTGTNPLIQHEVVFTLEGLPDDFDVEQIESIFVQYGTSISGRGDGGDGASFFELPLIPTPGSATLLALGGLLVAARRRR